MKPEFVIPEEGLMSDKFKCIEYDAASLENLEVIQERFTSLAESIEHRLINSRTRALALTSLEEASMWIGKSIRDDQIERTEEQEEAEKE